jgi:putative ABC transport system substrate-binding protein
MKRREFIRVFGAAAAGWPLAAHAQQSGRMRRIGFLIGGAESDPQIIEALAAFKTGLKGLGWIEGRNIQIDYRSPPPMSIACASSRRNWSLCNPMC